MDLGLTQPCKTGLLDDGCFALIYLMKSNVNCNIKHKTKFLVTRNIIRLVKIINVNETRMKLAS